MANFHYFPFYNIISFILFQFAGERRQLVGIYFNLFTHISDIA